MIRAPACFPKNNMALRLLLAESPSGPSLLRFLDTLPARKHYLHGTVGTAPMITRLASLLEVEAGFVLVPTGEKAEALRAKTEALAATLRQVIDERVREDQIVKRSDSAIAAGADAFCFPRHSPPLAGCAVSEHPPSGDCS